MKSQKILAFLILLFIIGNISSCKETPTDKKVENTAIITFLTGKVEIIQNGQSKQAKTKSTLKTNDIVKTGTNSFASIQVNSSVIRLDQKSTLKISDIIQEQSSHISLKNGSVLLKINKITRDNKFIVDTNTTVASVRGTVFKVSYIDNKSTISLKKGKVDLFIKKYDEDIKNTIDRIKKATEKVKVNLQAGKTAELKDAELTSQKEKAKIKVYIITEKQKIELEKVEKIPVIKDIKSKPAETLNKQLNEIIKQEKDIDKRLNKIIKTKILTLRDLQKKYGRLSVVKTKDKKTYIGSFRQKGSIMEIITIYGTVKIPGKNIEGVSIYTGKL